MINSNFSKLEPIQCPMGIKEKGKMWKLQWNLETNF